jgi:hypothetical protein
MGIKIVLSALLLILSVQQQQNEPQLEGIYTGTSCKMSIELKAVKQGFSYHLVTNKRSLKGTALISINGTGRQKQYIVQLKGAEMDEPSELRKNPYISFSLSADTITLQNTGNSMNYYVQLQECDEKYITLVKSKSGY